MKNIYYTPEEYGLKVVGVIDTGGSYEFDMTVVLKDEDDNLFYVQDAGCSCPTPFEDKDMEDLTKIDSIEQLEEAVLEYHKYAYENEREKAELRKDARNLIKEYFKK